MPICGTNFRRKLETPVPAEYMVPTSCDVPLLERLLICSALLSHIGARGGKKYVLPYICIKISVHNFRQVEKLIQSLQLKKDHMCCLISLYTVNPYKPAWRGTWSLCGPGTRLIGNNCFLCTVMQDHKINKITNTCLYVNFWYFVHHGCLCIHFYLKNII